MRYLSCHILNPSPPDTQTSEAAEKCLNEKRKTINGEDILTSMRSLGFDNYEGVLKVYLAKYREVSYSCLPFCRSYLTDAAPDQPGAIAAKPARFWRRWR